MQQIIRARTKCEVWTRVMGYHRPVSHFNIGKKSEHYSRKHYEECLTANAAFVAEYSPAAAAVC
ncbi:MAG: anaerobic ribonucleoside-triphosphate reductase [Patescibacteria group bacterium]|jgi:hypothetical protein